MRLRFPEGDFLSSIGIFLTGETMAEVANIAPNKSGTNSHPAEQKVIYK